MVAALMLLFFSCKYVFFVPRSRLMFYTPKHSLLIEYESTLLLTERLKGILEQTEVRNLFKILKIHKNVSKSRSVEKEGRNENTDSMSDTKRSWWSIRSSNTACVIFYHNIDIKYTNGEFCLKKSMQKLFADIVSRQEWKECFWKIQQIKFLTTQDSS